MQKDGEERCMAALWRLSALREVMEGIFIPLRPERRCLANGIHNSDKWLLLQCAGSSL